MEKLLDDWAYIKNSSEYKKAIEQIKERTEPQAKQKAVLQNLRMQINRLRQKGEDTEDLVLELWEQEKSYARWKKRPLGSPTPPRSAHNPVARAAPARRALRARVAKADIPPRPDWGPPFVFNWSHELTPELDVDWTLCPQDLAKELALREMRNTMLKEGLLRGGIP